MRTILLVAVAACAAAPRPLHSTSYFNASPAELLPLVADAARGQGFQVADVDASQASLVAVREGAPMMLVQVRTPPNPTGIVEPPCQGPCKMTFVVTPLAYDHGRVAILDPIPPAIDAQAHALLVAIEAHTVAERFPRLIMRDPARVDE